MNEKTARWLDRHAVFGVVEFAHHDLGWHMGSFAQEAYRSDQEILEALSLMEGDTGFCWTQEHGVYLRSFLARHPDRFEELRRLVQEGRFELGAGYSSPDTSFVTGESLVRQFVYGKRWTDELFGGPYANVYYNTDVPGLCAQMPQILQKAGVKYLFCSRTMAFPGKKKNRFCLWQAPDGTAVNSLLMYHYSTGTGTYGGDMNSDTYLKELLTESEEVFRTSGFGRLLPAVYSADCLLPVLLTERIRTWNVTAEVGNLPPMAYMTMQGALAAVFKEGPKTEIPQETLRGEWPSIWVYENAASDRQAFRWQREAESLLRQTELLSVIRACEEGSFAEYPAAVLEEVWLAVLHACHGYAPQVAIEEFRAMYEKAYRIAGSLLNLQLDWLASQVDTNVHREGQAIILFNSLSWRRDDIVELPLPSDITEPFTLSDEDGRALPLQRTDEGKVLLAVKDVPPMGYKTCFIKRHTGDVVEVTVKGDGNVWTEPYENDFYRVIPGVGGLEEIIDKENGGRSLFDTGKFKISEWLDFSYGGMGAGEQLFIWQPGHEPARLREFQPSAWICLEKGSVRTVFETSAQTPRGPVSLQVILYETVKRIDFRVIMESAGETPARQLRLAFPVRVKALFGEDGCVMKQGGSSVAYDTPFYTVQVGQELFDSFSAFNPNTADADDTSNPLNCAIRPRCIQNWIMAGDESCSVTFSSDMLSWDYQDATANPLRTPVLQPVLLSTSKSCHGQYGWWLQPGRFEATFSMTSGRSFHDNRFQSALQAGTPLIARIQPYDREGSMPTRYSAFSTSADNLVLSAVKKAESSNDVIVRLYESSGADTRQAVLHTSREYREAKYVNLVEEPMEDDIMLKDRDVVISASPWSIQTIRFTL